VGMGVKCTEDCYLAYQHVAEKALRYPDKQYVQSGSKFEYRQQQKRLHGIENKQRFLNKTTPSSGAISDPYSMAGISEALPVTPLNVESSSSNNLGASDGFGNKKKSKGGKRKRAPSSSSSQAHKDKGSIANEKTKTIGTDPGSPSGGLPCSSTTFDLTLQLDVSQLSDAQRPNKKRRKGDGEREVSGSRPGTDFIAPSSSVPFYVAPRGHVTDANKSTKGAWTTNNSEENQRDGGMLEKNKQDTLSYDLVEEFDRYLDGFDVM
jgi:hypothetical protein